MLKINDNIPAKALKRAHQKCKLCRKQACGSGYFVNCFHFQQSLYSYQSLAWTLIEPWLYLIYKRADKHDYQNQQLTIYKGTLLVKMIA